MKKVSGRPTFFRGKAQSESKTPRYRKPMVPPTSVLMTAYGRKMLDQTCKRLTRDYKRESKNPKATISRNVVIEALIRMWGPTLTLKQIRREDARRR
jgi:hypothetical protein